MKTVRFKALILLVSLLVVSATLEAQEVSINTMASDLAKALATGKPKRVAVVDFTDLNSAVTLLGKHFAQEFEIGLATSPYKVDLVNRSRLQQIIKEQKLNTTGLIDPDTARQLGKFAGVEVLIVGTVTPLDETVRLDVEAIDTEDARVLAATSRNILKTRDIRILIGEGRPPLPLNGEVGGPVAPFTPAQTPPQPTQVFESHDIRFVLNSCLRSSTSIVCKLTISNQSDDRNISIHAGTCNNPPSRMIDGNGREFTANQVILGSKHDQWCIAEGTLVSGVPTQTEVRFDNIPSSVTSISLLDLPSWVGNDRIDVSFHKVGLVAQRF